MLLLLHGYIMYVYVFSFRKVCTLNGLGAVHFLPSGVILDEPECFLEFGLGKNFEIARTHDHMHRNGNHRIGTMPKTHTMQNKKANILNHKSVGNNLIRTLKAGVSIQPTLSAGRL